jgi:hypothetical protein
MVQGSDATSFSAKRACLVSSPTMSRTMTLLSSAAIGAQRPRLRAATGAGA